MPKIKREELPEALLRHLIDRINEREFSEADPITLAAWMDANPEVPEGPWFKRFDGMIAGGEGELVKTLLLPAQTPMGDEVD